MIKVGLIGCGYWGKNYARTIRDMPEMCLKYVQDIKKPNNLFSKDIIFTTDVNSILKDSEIAGVIIATPPETHYDIASRAIKAGKNVLVEKPMTTNSEDAERLLDLSIRENKVLMVGHIFKYNEGMQDIKMRVDCGEIGDIRFMDSRRVGLGPIRKDASALWDLASHDVYIARFIIGEMPKSVSYTGQSHNGKVDDVAQVNLRFQNSLVSIYANWGYPVKERRLMIGGTKKAILFDDIEPSEKVRIYSTFLDYRTIKSGDFGEFQAITREGDISIPKLRITQPLEEELKHFSECIQGKKCKSDGYDGVETVRVLEAAEKSKKSGGLEVKI